jgi:Fe-S-cluster containining protein
MKVPKTEEILKPLEGHVFRFNCHKDIACFNDCCARLRLILTPYDILRMKNRLGLSSQDFLELYTDTFIEAHSPFPMVRVKMNKGEEETCPFLTKQGCAIYEDRPGACRLYPLGRASATAEGKRSAIEKFFVVEESHCQGFYENKSWTLDQWLKHEGVKEYNAMNDQWLKLLSSSRSLGIRKVTRKIQMFFMASYNLDMFRKFLFESRFFDLFHLAPGLKEKLARDDMPLMIFAIDWLRFSLFGEKTIQPKDISGKPWTSP